MLRRRLILNLVPLIFAGAGCYLIWRVGGWMLVAGVFLFVWGNNMGLYKQFKQK